MILILLLFMGIIYPICGFIYFRFIKKLSIKEIFKIL